MQTQSEQDPVRGRLSMVERGRDQNNQKDDVTRYVTRPDPGFDNRFAHHDQRDRHGEHDQSASSVSGDEDLAEPVIVPDRVKVTGHRSEDLWQAASARK